MWREPHHQPVHWGPIHMLNISRLNGQRLIVTTPDGVKIEVLLTDARKGRARVGIQAPKEYRVDRAEVLEQEALRRQRQEDSFGNR